MALLVLAAIIIFLVIMMLGQDGGTLKAGLAAGGKNGAMVVMNLGSSFSSFFLVPRAVARILAHGHGGRRGAGDNVHRVHSSSPSVTDTRRIDRRLGGAL